MFMDLFAVIDIKRPPQKLTWSEGGNYYYHYFPPPLPNVIILFLDGSKKQIEQTLDVKVAIESSLEEKFIGEISKKSPFLYWNGEWSSEEKEAAETVQELGQVLKISVIKKNNHDDEGIGSQDVDSKNEKDDFIFSDVELEQFEKSLEQFEEEFKENQSSIKSLHKKVISSEEKPRKRKVSDFFKKVSKKNDVLCDVSNKGKEARLTTMDIAKNVKRSNNIQNKNKRSHNHDLENNDNITSTFPTTKKLKKASSVTKFSDFLSGERPSHRWGHVFCKICDNDIITIGGQGFRHQLNADSLWTFNTNTKEWTSRASDNAAIDRRMGHTAVYDEKSRQIYLFGGSKHKKWYNDVYTLDVDAWQWTKVETIGKAPTRAYHSCTRFYDELLVFGGVFPNPDPQPDGCSNDLVIFDIENKSWYSPIVNGEIPDARSGHSACILDHKLYIFGGWDSPQCFNDLFSLDMGIMNFCELAPIGVRPSPRTWHSTTVLRDNKSFCIYGGYNGENSLSDIFIYSSVHNTWKSISVKQQLTKRAGHQGVLCDMEEGEKVLVFGGGDNDGEFYNDLCEVKL